MPAMIRHTRDVFWEATGIFPPDVSIAKFIREKWLESEIVWPLPPTPIFRQTKFIHQKFSEVGGKLINFFWEIDRRNQDLLVN